MVTLDEAEKPRNFSTGGWALAAERASWAATGTFHREQCVYRRLAPTESGTFRDAAEKIIQPCLGCWPRKGEVQKGLILATWAAILRAKYLPGAANGE